MNPAAVAADGLLLFWHVKNRIERRSNAFCGICSYSTQRTYLSRAVNIVGKGGWIFRDGDGYDWQFSGIIAEKCR
ncbi:MAG: hypothetical protein N2C12_00035 [Planctomycetales bacterium]